MKLTLTKKEILKAFNMPEDTELEIDDRPIVTIPEGGRVDVGADGIGRIFDKDGNQVFPE